MFGKAFTFLFVGAGYLLVFLPSAEFQPIKKDGNFVDASYHWRKRTMICKKILGADENDAAKCALQSNDQKTSEFGAGCYNEFVPQMRNIRTLCPLNCMHSDEATILSKQPSNNHRCSQFFNYGIVKLSEDAYFWRSGPCLNETINFEIRCGFPFRTREYVDNTKDEFFTLI